MRTCQGNASNSLVMNQDYNLCPVQVQTAISYFAGLCYDKIFSGVDVLVKIYI